ncbi:hypothetical protein MRB53_020012 [Persea americana]|uniref:Uncharacterized protein n=1 Tax=Persea americana TaxID=3435 RepID=A0ACC2L0A4_PERAE|nr:hypothetical protein MRB53_020012 [Persea americana]
MLPTYMLDLESRKRDEVLGRRREEFELAGGQLRDCGYVESKAQSDEFLEEEGFGLDLKSVGHFGSREVMKACPRHQYQALPACSMMFHWEPHDYFILMA